MPAGRPEVEIDYSKVEALAAQGLTLEQIASVLGIHLATLCAHKSKYSELNEAWKRGQDKGIATVTNALFENAKKGNLGAQCFYLKNRDSDNWKERVEQNQSGDLKHEITVRHVDEGL